MALMKLACPLCSGAIEVDEQFAGQQVACPYCAGAIAIPPASPPPGFGAPGLSPPPSAPSFAAPPFPAPGNSFAPPPPAPHPQTPAGPANVFQLACPLCANPFSVPSELQGQQVQCPLCAGVVSIPFLESPAAPPEMQATGTFSSPAQPPAFSPPTTFPAPAPQMPALGGSPPSSPAPSFGGQVSPNRPLPVSANRPIPLSANMPIPVSSLPNSAAPQPTTRPHSANAPVLIPTGDGRQVAVMESTKTVKKGRREIELRKLTPEEKAQRRRTMNLIVMGGCLVFLLIVFYVLIVK